MRFKNLFKEWKKLLSKPNPRIQDIILRFIQNLSFNEKEKYNKIFFTIYRLAKSNQKIIGDYIENKPK